MRFELTRGNPNGLAVHRLNHSATASRRLLNHVVLPTTIIITIIIIIIIGVVVELRILLLLLLLLRMLPTSMASILSCAPEAPIHDHPDHH